MSQQLIQRLNATAEAMRASAPDNVRVKNLAQQLDSAAEALALYTQITGIADILDSTPGAGIVWQDIAGRSVAVFGEHSRGLCDAGLYTIKLRNCEPFLNQYQLYHNGQFVSSNVSFMAIKEAAMKHYERLLKIKRAAVAHDKMQLASLADINDVRR